ncbi:MAG TPA: tryptophanase [Candidatus Limnocylindrales bacterium]|nr:tryptophanase [Candidatus Limnocylindrales bacterium]
MRDRELYAEPYKIKMIEPIRIRDRETREKLIADAGYNVFNIKAEDVYIDLLTDSGTTAMSANQWAGIMLGDESYAGCSNFYNLQRALQDIFGYKFVVPTHQGRAAENILMSMFVGEGQRVLGNMHFDTTEGHIRLRKATPVNLVIDEGLETVSDHPFKGNINLDLLEEELKNSTRREIPLVIITVTCNSNGGQPVAMDNIRAASVLAKKYKRPLFLDAARFAENCYFIKQRDAKYHSQSIRKIAREMFSYADGCTMSSKKDALVNIGGFLALKKNSEWYERAVQIQIYYEGFRTYGGLAGRDLEALARGLYEGIEIDYLEDRIGQVHHLGKMLTDEGIPIILPVGGHGVFIDARSFLPHLPQSKLPAQALVVELYRVGGIRAVELGTCAFGYTNPTTGEEFYPRQELVRLAIPRRVYTDRHMRYVADILIKIAGQKETIRGMEITDQTKIMRHFTARFRIL